ncbi:MAG: TetR/AcrR family transcriptional regulator [Caulobacterales bacterium]|nr:TetR/AcrR family transcriptional regulator [Caulobacterales bacterium]MCA0372935.1 TetR/AcrR family transcriptional regulator [Pseudomonadota bacterium]
MNLDAKPDKTAYHHGNLIEALLEVAVSLIEEKGVEQLSVRELAKRANVSPGAPFRHFKNKTALLTAVAEQAMARLTIAIQNEIKNEGIEDPIETFHSLGRAYLNWALNNPTHFQIISSRNLIDFNSSKQLVEQNENIRIIMIRLINKAKEQGILNKKLDPNDLIFAARAFVYGVARMWVDRHFNEWNIKDDAQIAMQKALNLFISSIRN